MCAPHRAPSSRNRDALHCCVPASLASATVHSAADTRCAAGVQAVWQWGNLTLGASKQLLTARALTRLGCHCRPAFASQVHGQEDERCGPRLWLQVFAFDVSPDTPRWAALAVKLNGNRKVTGTLRGFDQFLNIVLDEAVDLATKESMGTIVVRGNSVLLLEPLERLQ